MYAIFLAEYVAGTDSLNSQTFYSDYDHAVWPCVDIKAEIIYRLWINYLLCINGTDPDAMCNSITRILRIIVYDS